MTLVAELLINVLYAFIIVMFIRIIFSWISPYPTNAVTRLAYRVTEPGSRPFASRTGTAPGPVVRSNCGASSSFS